MNKLTLIDKLQLFPLSKQHCTHYSIDNEEQNYGWEEEDDKHLLDSVDKTNLCNENDIKKYIYEEIPCYRCKNNLILQLTNVKKDFYEFKGIKELKSENSITCNNIHFNLQYLFSSYQTRSSVLFPSDTQVDFSTNRYRKSLTSCFLQMQELLTCQELTEDLIIKQDNVLYEILQVLIRYIHVIHKFANVTIFETSPPIEIHAKMWKLIDLLYCVMYKHVGIYSKILNEYLEELSLPLYPLLNIHTPHYFEEFKNKCGNDPDAIHKVLVIKKNINLTRFSDLTTFFRSMEKHLSKYENELVEYMNRTNIFHDSEEYIGPISFSCDTSILFVLLEYLFGPLLRIEKEKIYTFIEELQIIDLRAFQVITNQHAVLNKVRERLYKNVIPNDFPLIPEYREEIYGIMKKLDAEIKYHQETYERQIKHEESIAIVNKRKKNDFSSRVFYGISIFKIFCVIRKISTFIHFLNDSKVLLQDLICGGDSHISEYLDIIKCQIQYKNLNERFQSLRQEYLYDELQKICDLDSSNKIASKSAKKKSKKKTKNKKMESPNSTVPEKLEWISKVNPSESTNSLSTLLQDDTSTSDSSDGERWTHVVTTNASKKKKPTKILQKNDVKTLKNGSGLNNTNNNNNTKKEENVQVNNSNVKEGVSFAQALLKKKELLEIQKMPNVQKAMQEKQKNVEPVVVPPVPVIQVMNNNDQQNQNQNQQDIQQNQNQNQQDIQQNQNQQQQNINKKQKKKQQRVQPPPPPPPLSVPVPTIPLTLPANRELTSERYFARIPDYIHIPNYNPQNFYLPHDSNPNTPRIQQQILIPTIAYVPQMYSTPYNMMYPTYYY
jgi:hypothetical protein